MLGAVPLLIPIVAALPDAAGVAAFAAGIVVSATVAFIAGVRYTRSAMRRSIERAKKNLTTLFAHVADSIENAERACCVLESYPRLQLSLDQLERLEQKQSALLETVGRIVDSQVEAAPPKVAPDEPKPLPTIDWILAPEDGVTKLPSREAFDANLEILLAAGAEHGFRSGLLLVKIDKIDALKTRFGLSGVQEFARQFAGRICRSMTDADVACHIGPELFAVLMPGVETAAGKVRASAIRDAIRRQHFRAKTDGPEVLVTASLGMTTFNGREAAAIILDRGRTALAKSEKRGRNQLHIDDGSKLTLCPA